MTPSFAPARAGASSARLAWLATLFCAPAFAVAQAGPAPANPAPIDYGLVLDGAYVSEDLALAHRERGFGLGHAELTAGGRVDDIFSARFTAALHHHHGETEVDVEEAFVDALALPAGLQLRAGRFLSQVGYLNERHVHVDDFTERPLLYRAFLGTHWSDTGVRLNWVAPTALYWRIGLEAFDGGRLAGESSSRHSVGVATLSTRLGDDVGLSHSWQFGLSFLRNRTVPSPTGDGGHDDHDHDHDHDHGHDHDHAHGAGYTGERMFIADAVWKWAPGGNNAARQLRLSGEYARLTDLNEFATSDDIHEAWYLAAVYRFAPQWEVGVRTGVLEVSEPHGDHFHQGRLRETSLMLAWVRSHFSTLRLQWTTQQDRGGFPQADNALTLQYVMSLGAHGAHSF